MNHTATLDFAEIDEKDVQLAEAVEQAAALVDDRLQLARLTERLHEIATAIRTDCFRVVVVGGFNKGKSTLLNAMLGSDILPQRTTPATAVITLLEYADAPVAQLHFVDPTQKPETMTLAEFKERIALDPSETEDDRVKTDRFDMIAKAVVGYPNDLLRHRVQIVDSPGLDESPVRTARTMDFLKDAHAVVLVLDATKLLDEHEVRFLETQLLPRGLRNIFFVLNKWNLVAESVLRPTDAAREYADLEQRIRTRLTPYCVIDGKDLSAQRIFRVNALAAEKARLQAPVEAATLLESQVPHFEAALGDFLAHGRRAARIGLIDVEMKRIQTEIDRSIGLQSALAAKSVEEIEIEIAAVAPHLDRLRGIKVHIENFLRAQSAGLQARLGASFEHMLAQIDANLEESVAGFDLSEIFQGSLILRLITDVFRTDDDKVAKLIERVIRPQIDAMIQPELLRWQEAVKQNELRVVQIDVEKYLEDEAEEYRRVMQKIEEEIGSVNRSLDIQDLVSGWLSDPTQGGVGPRVDMTSVQVMGDLSWLLGAIAAEVLAEVLLHMTFVWLPIVGILITGARLLWREGKMREQVRSKIVEAIRKGLEDARVREGRKIRAQIEHNFERFLDTISGNFDAEIAVVDATLQQSLERRTQHTLTAEQEVQRLTMIQGEISRQVQKIGALATAY